MIRGLTPIHFLKPLPITDDLGYLGVAPMRTGRVPIPGDTPFGITDSDIKGPGIPTPLLLKLRGRIFRRVITALKPYPPQKLTISGITRNSAGAVLPSSTVILFTTIEDRAMETLVSDAVTGAFAFSAVGTGRNYYIVAYKVGVPDTTGTTVNTLVGI